MAPFASLYNNRVRHRRKPGYAGSLETLLTCIGRGLFSISLDLHAARDSSVGLTAGKIGNVDEGIVESGQNVADTKCVFDLFSSSSNWRSVVGDFLLLFAFFTFGTLGTTLLLLSL